MLKKIIGLSLVASLGMASAAFAQSTGTTGGSNQPNQSNPAGLGTSLSVDFQTAGSSCCGKYYDHSNANGNAKNLANHFSQKLAAMQLAIIEAMKLSTGQLSGNLREQSGAEHTLADQQDDRATVKSIEQARIDAIRDAESGSNSCRVITGSRGGAAGKGAKKYSRQLAVEVDKFLTGQEGPAKDGQSAAMLARVEAHCKYATQADVDIGLCSAVGEKPNADISAADSVFYQEDGAVSTYTPEREAAAKLFVLNAFAGSTVTPLSKDTINEPSEREKAANNISYSSRSAIATSVAADYIGNRVAQKDKKLLDWAQGSVQKMPGFQNADFDKAGISNHDWMKIMSRNFLLDSERLGACDKTSTNALKCIKNMVAVQTYMQFESYDMLEKIGFILANQLSIMNDDTRKDIIRH
ncbi:hypothetical protein [Mesorhizobium sp. SP-1A]|uniref:hypothetical protein n=1 Tax=Mesorhizobium sp. SP-1A TaxID=3077840 RepID=UPI0028F749B4|nr:hypothetical protein [Mesorhizobium sp. SP-1A]